MAQWVCTFFPFLSGMNSQRWHANIEWLLPFYQTQCFQPLFSVGDEVPIHSIQQIRICSWREVNSTKYEYFITIHKLSIRPENKERNLEKIKVFIHPFFYSTPPHPTRTQTLNEWYALRLILTGCYWLRMLLSVSARKKVYKSARLSGARVSPFLY